MATDRQLDECVDLIQLWLSRLTDGRRELTEDAMQKWAAEARVTLLSVGVKPFEWD